MYGCEYLRAMGEEYTARYGKVHKSTRLYATFLRYAYLIPDNTDNRITKHPMCFGEFTPSSSEYLVLPTEQYLEFYQATKTFARYKRTSTPNFMKGYINGE